MNERSAKLDMGNQRHFKSQGSPLQVAGRRRHRGFTLIEVLISMTIFSIAILGLAIGAGSVMRANQTSYFSTIAISLAQDKLEELKANPATLSPDCPTAPCESPKPTHDGVAFTRTWVVTNGSPVPGVSRIDVQVEWTDHMTHTVSISSAVLN
jgi:prepilin-type N-terminal cleavage/methylation domain-containing protein